MKNFSGSDYSDPLDYDRLITQIARVLGVMSDGRWHTLREVAVRIKAPEASVSAQLRNLRKPRHGNYVIERRRAEGVPQEQGLFEYRLLPPTDYEHVQQELL